MRRTRRIRRIAGEFLERGIDLVEFVSLWECGGGGGRVVGATALVHTSPASLTPPCRRGSLGPCYDPERGRRVKTVELVVEEAEWIPAGVVYLVDIGWHETALRGAGETPR